MRKENFIFLFIFSIIFPLFFSPYTYATRSRLSGMGELSIVIEDESNMINLWDFAGNPAGFLADEKGSVIKGDFIIIPTLDITLMEMYSTAEFLRVFADRVTLR